MIELDIKKLSKTELYELIAKISEENGMLKERNNQLEEKLTAIEINIDNAGTIAEASVAINKLMEIADKTASDYVDNAARIEERAQQKAEEMIQEAQEKCNMMIEEAELKVSEARIQCAAMVATAKKNIDDQWDELKAKLERYCEVHDSLKNQIGELNVKDII